MPLDAALSAAAAEVAAVTTGSIAVLTEVVTDIDVLSNYAV